jgi:biotin transport system ATP-binding protein/energy-coupling factor transport system ATP-binding protein
MIQIRNLTYGYDAAEPVLKGVDMEIAPGQHVGIIGPNGCGKTTLLRHLNALLLPREGEVLVDGMSTRDGGKVAEIRRLVGMVFQNPDNQIVGTTVEEDVAFGPGNLGLPPAEIRRRVSHALEAVRLTPAASRAPHTLSGGEKRLLAIAGVLAMRPRYIALDEPTSSLDTRGRERVLAVIRDLHGQGITIIHITHDTDEIVTADRVMIMQRGAILRAGTPSEVFSRVEEVKGLGLDVPTGSEILWRLRNLGQEIPCGSPGLDAALREIAKRMNGGVRRDAEEG